MREKIAEGYNLFHRSLAEAPQDNALDLTITRTAMADNLRRWAEDLMPSDTATAMSYLSEAYLIMTEAVLTDLSPRAQTTLREIAFALGQFSEQNGQVADAISYYDRSISWQTTRTREKRRAFAAALYIAGQLLRAEKRDDSRRYIDLARTYCGSPEERWQVEFLEMYSEPGRRLEMYSGPGRRRAVLSRVILGKGYGFLGNDRGSAIFLHYSGVAPPVTVAQFEQLEGQELSFVVIDRDGRPVASRACTRPSTLDDARRV
jgi:cold shock CspA family protein